MFPTEAFKHEQNAQKTLASEAGLEQGILFIFLFDRYKGVVMLFSQLFLI